MAHSPLKPTEDPSPHHLDSLSASEAADVMDSIDRHRTKIFAAIALVAIAIGAYLVVTQINTQKHLAAAEAYTTAANKGDIAALDGVLIEFPGWSTRSYWSRPSRRD